jgi:acetylornithine deacetylase/succinyl-diaminopimelate desuccinylase-like protein
MLDDVLRFIDDNLPASLDRLFSLLRIESISTDPAYREGCRAAADWVVATLSELGFAAVAHPTPGHPIVLARADGAAAAPRALFYGHYDVQPVDPIDLWEAPPFAPRLVTRPDGRRWIAARGAADDKGQIMTFIEAVRAWRAVTGTLPIGVTMLIEGEEESGSPSLKPFLEAHAAALASDVALVCDTDMWDRTTPAVTVSLRGLAAEELTITAADRDLHSGLFGGAARNPLHVLAAVLAGLHAPDGRVTLPGFYDRVGEPPPEIRRQWESLAFDPARFLRDVGLSVPAGEAGRSVLEQIWSRPTAEVNGISGGYAGRGFKTVIPARASAKVSFRLVGDQDPVAVRDAFRAFVRARLPADCTAEFASFAGSRALTLAPDTPWMRRARRALAAEWKAEPRLVGGGGSIPVMIDLKEILGVEPLMIGFSLDDDRIHSPNEKYELTSFHGGIRSWARVLAALSEEA